MANFPWIKNYPEGISAEIKLYEYESLVDLFEKSCAKFKDRVAFENMGVKMTYGEADVQSRHFAAYLQSIGLQKGDRIAIQMPNLLQFPVAFFGALRAGLTVVNTNPLYTPREMEHQFKDSGAKAIVIVANFASNLEKIIQHTSIRHVIVTEIGDLVPGLKGWLTNFVVKH
ncbi:MAG TPA: AMP-binding protein, partial [Cyclobacteriaceae bacterium]|nr:AMP-binding protein [Cyclobacteriaceae bacterium]